MWILLGVRKPVPRTRVGAQQGALQGGVFIGALNNFKVVSNYAQNCIKTVNEEG